MRSGRSKTSARLVAWLFLFWRCVSCKKTEELRIGIFFAVAIPIDIPDKSVSLSYYFEANYGMPAINSTFLEGNHLEKRSLDRRLLYDIVQSKLESHGYPGRACLLRTICESAKFPFSQNGLVGDLLHIVFSAASIYRTVFAYISVVTQMITELNTRPEVLRSVFWRKMLNSGACSSVLIFRPSRSQRENLESEIEEAEDVQDCAKFSTKCPLNLLDIISHSIE